MKKNHNSQSGNVLIIVLIGVVLFSALSITVARSMNDDSTRKMSEREVELAVADIINFASAVERGVNQMLRHNISESDISFQNNVDSGYVNANCSDTKCRIFHPDGGGISWLNPPADVNDGTIWSFNARNLITGLGCDTESGDRCTELTMFLPNLYLDICQEINEKAGISVTTPPTDSDNAISDALKHTGDFTYANTIDDSGNTLLGKKTGCVQETAGTYLFYHVLLVR